MCFKQEKKAAKLLRIVYRPNSNLKGIQDTWNITECTVPVTFLSST